MNFFEIPKRLALVFGLQIVACVYIVLGVSALIKIRQADIQDGYHPISGLSLWVKYHGWMMMALPLAWYWFHVRRWIKSGADLEFLACVVVSGVAVLALLLTLAIVASLGVFRPI